ncbi:ROK family protein [Streptomyces sp. NPDC051921]|uniref:ROK family protein n=1 Tax=Streptomyces sp. NPDC051921 TaxID=3155806 RepID=UPI00343C8854
MNAVAPLVGPVTGTVVSLDVGGTYIKGGVLTDGSTALTHTERWDTRADRGPEAVLETVLTCAEQLVERHPDAAAAGIAVPGIVDEESGLAVMAANLGWRGVPVQDWLAEHLALPVAFGHDVRAGGLAEAREGAGRGCADFLFVPVGTGIAAAVVSRGRALTGAHGGAGELGHVTVRPGGDRCRCGGRGCLETVASAAAVARRYTRATGRHGITAQDVQRRADSGDAVAAGIWAEAIEALADALTVAVTLYDPERIVIGGGLAGAGEAWLTRLREALGQRLTFQAVPEIREALLGDRAGCVGAALLARDLLERGLPEGDLLTPGLRRRTPAQRALPAREREARQRPQEGRAARELPSRGLSPRAAPARALPARGFVVRELVVRERTAREPSEGDRAARALPARALPSPARPRPVRPAPPSTDASDDGWTHIPGPLTPPR